MLVAWDHVKLYLPELSGPFVASECQRRLLTLEYPDSAWRRKLLDGKGGPNGSHNDFVYYFPRQGFFTGEHCVLQWRVLVPEAEVLNTHSYLLLIDG